MANPLYKKKRRKTCSLILLIVLICILLVLLTRRGTIDLSGLTGSGETISVLFIGNSFTFYHEMPKLLEALSKREPEGILIKAEMEVSGGVSLEWHYEGGKARERIAEGDWDYVVLQELSSRPIMEPDEFSRYVRLFRQDIHEVEAIPVLYLTWADPDRLEEQEFLNDTFYDLAYGTDLPIAPVGPAFMRALKDDESLVLYEEDQHHPSLLGSYLAARVFYTLILDDWGVEESAPGLGIRSVLSPARPSAVGAELDAYFKKISKEVVLNQEESHDF